MRIKTIRLFWAANLVLIGVGWTSALFSYPRLPEKIPLWVNFFGQQVLVHKKSPLFFIYAAAQTLFCLLFILAARFLINRHSDRQKKDPRASKKAALSGVFEEEMALLALIFFNLVFIHIQTGIIYLAYNRAGGFNPYYFLMLFAVILLLIPYYRLRIKMKQKQEGS